jgi:hypothetical protein
MAPHTVRARVTPGRHAVASVPAGTQTARVQLDLGGHPLHTRALTVVLTERADGRLDVGGTVLDLRKRGFVPVGGDLQGPGIVHDMRLHGVVDPASATLESLAAEQRAVAFEASATTGGESCRDPIEQAAALAGAALDGAFARRVSAALGGPRGCSHLATLAHLLGTSAAWALERDRQLAGTRPRRRAGERVFRRDVIVDGHEPAPGQLLLGIQLTDLHFTPAPAVARPMDRFAAELELRAVARVDLPGLRLASLAGAERRRSAADLGTAPWRDRADVLGRLVGLGLGPGVTGTLLDRFGAADGDRPLLDALLMLAPAVIQCVAALSEGWVLAAQASPSLVGMGGIPDSCYMWRRGGGLLRARDPDAAG